MPLDPPPREQLARQAAANPGGYVYDLDWAYRDDQRTPPEAIRGAWRVDAQGQLTEQYDANPRHRPVQRSNRVLPAYLQRAARFCSDEWLVEMDPSAEHLFPAIPETLVVGWWYVDAAGVLSNLFRPNARYAAP